MSAGGWLLLNAITIVALAFYSMVEMACVSLNRARLHFLAVKGQRRARRLQELLADPTRLFGTTLLGVNVATVVGSECAREFYASLGLNPDLAPLTQVMVVIVFGELAPMFAARHYPEHVAMLGSTLLYLSSRVAAPVIFLLTLITSLLDRLISGGHIEADQYLSKEELERMISEQDREVEQRNVGTQPLNSVAASLLKLHTLTAEEVATPLSDFTLLSDSCSVAQMRNMMRKKPYQSFPVYHQRPSNIVGIVTAHDVIGKGDDELVRAFSHAPWYLTVKTPLSLILRQFRHNNEEIAVVLDDQGQAIGIVFFEEILRTLFADQGGRHGGEGAAGRGATLLAEITVPATMTVGQLKQRYGIQLSEEPHSTLEELFVRAMGHSPEKGDQIELGPLLLTVKERTLLELKTITIKSK